MCFHVYPILFLTCCVTLGKSLSCCTMGRRAGRTTCSDHGNTGHRLISLLDKWTSEQTPEARSSLRYLGKKVARPGNGMGYRIQSQVPTDRLNLPLNGSVTLDLHLHRSFFLHETERGGPCGLGTQTLLVQKSIPRASKYYFKGLLSPRPNLSGHKLMYYFYSRNKNGSYWE